MYPQILARYCTSGIWNRVQRSQFTCTPPCCPLAPGECRVLLPFLRGPKGSHKTKAGAPVRGCSAGQNLESGGSGEAESRGEGAVSPRSANPEVGAGRVSANMLARESSSTDSTSGHFKSNAMISKARNARRACLINLALHAKKCLLTFSCP